LCIHVTASVPPLPSAQPFHPPLTGVSSISGFFDSSSNGEVKIRMDQLTPFNLPTPRVLETPLFVNVGVRLTAFGFLKVRTKTFVARLSCFIDSPKVHSTALSHKIGLFRCLEGVSIVKSNLPLGNAELVIILSGLIS